MDELEIAKDEVERFGELMDDAWLEYKDNDEELSELEASEPF